jgi:hypothetical protein
MLAGSGGAARAGAPFLADDPGTSEPGQVEVNISVQYTHGQGESSGALPGVEVNYGLTPALQLHFYQPLAFDHLSGGNTKIGAGDTELGVKYRVWDEDVEGWLPAGAVFPVVQLPTGDHERGLGAGETRAFLPLWLGKTFDDWAVFGGGGYFVNPGPGNKDYWFAGSGVLLKATESLSLGAELFRNTADAIDGRNATGFNIGGSYSLTENQAILLSVGRGLQHADQTNRFSTFVSYHIVF